MACMRASGWIVKGHRTDTPPIGPQCRQRRAVHQRAGLSVVLCEAKSMCVVTHLRKKCRQCGPGAKKSATRVLFVLQARAPKTVGGDFVFLGCTNEYIKLATCGHHFHFNFLTPWAQQNKKSCIVTRRFATFGVSQICMWDPTSHMARQTEGGGGGGRIQIVHVARAPHRSSVAVSWSTVVRRCAPFPGVLSTHVVGVSTSCLSGLFGGWAQKGCGGQGYIGRGGGGG